MARPLPKVRRVDSGHRLMLVLVAFIVVLAGALTYLVVVGAPFGGEAKSDVERDYELLVKGVAENPEDPATIMSLAEAEYELGREDEALEHAELAIEYAEGAQFYNMRYATMLVRSDRLEDAVAALETEIEIAGEGDAEPYFLLAQIKADQKDLDAAIEAMGTGLRIEPNAADMRVVFGEIYQQAGEKDLAAEQFSTALRFLPDEQRAMEGLDRLGVAYEPSEGSSPHETGSGE